MAKQNYDELVLERKEGFPEAKTVVKGTVITKSARGLYIDINKVFEGYVSAQELGDKNPEEYLVGEKVDVFVNGGQNPDGIFKLSIKEIESAQKWSKLEELQNQNLEVEISKLVKSGVEAKILLTEQIGFIPQRYLDTNYGALNGKSQEEWIGVQIPVRLHELDKSKNKIILNNREVIKEQREAKAEETLRALSLGQLVSGTVVRTTDFGVFVDIGGIDALIPASELSWRRFNKTSDLAKAGDQVEAKVFRIDLDEKKVGLSVKQAQPDPWTVLPEDFVVGAKVSGKVVTHANFGVFVEVLPGIEALLHSSNMADPEKAPEVGSTVEAELVNINAAQKRMGISTKLANATSEEKVTEAVAEPQTEEPKAVESTEEKPTEETKGEELEYVK